MDSSAILNWFELLPKVKQRYEELRKLSFFGLNYPFDKIFMPIVEDWCKKINICGSVKDKNGNPQKILDTLLFFLDDLNYEKNPIVQPYMDLVNKGLLRKLVKIIDLTNEKKFSYLTNKEFAYKVYRSEMILIKKIKKEIGFKTLKELSENLRRVYYKNCDIFEHDVHFFLFIKKSGITFDQWRKLRIFANQYLHFSKTTHKWGMRD